MKEWLVKNKKSLKIVGIALLILSLLITLILVKQNQDSRSSAAAPDKLETEGGVLSSTGVSKQTDSQASGGQYVSFSSQTSGPTPTPSVQSGYGPRSAPAIPSGSNVYFVPSSIADDNTGDVGSALQSFINSVPNGSIIVFDQSKTAQGFTHKSATPDSIYRMTNGLILNNRSNLTFWGYNTKLNVIGSGTADSHSGFTVSGGSNIKILGFEIQGTNTKSGAIDAYTGHPGERQHGVAHIYETNGTEIADVWVHHVNGDGIYTACWGTWPTAGNYNWHHNLIELTGRQGITLNQTSSTLIENNIVRDSALYNIDGEDCKDGTQKLTNVIIRNNEIARQGWGADYGSHAISFEYDWNDPTPPALADFGPITIENNYFSAGAAPTSYSRYGNCGVTQINFTGPDGTRGHDLTIKGNQFNFLPANQCGPAARIEDFDRVNVTNNKFQGMTITITNSTSVTNSGNN